MFHSLYTILLQPSCVIKAILNGRKVNDKYAESALEAAKTLIQKENTMPVIINNNFLTSTFCNSGHASSGTLIFVFLFQISNLRNNFSMLRSSLNEKEEIFFKISMVPSPKIVINPIGSAVSEILRYRQTNKHPVTYRKDRANKEETSIKRRS